MSHINPWDEVLSLITSSGEADKLSTSALEVLNRLSDMSNPSTGFSITKPDEIAHGLRRSIDEIRRDLTDLVEEEIIKPVITIEQGLFRVHPRLTISSQQHIEQRA